MKPAQQPASTEKVDATPERVERGRYLANTVIGCPDCHSSFDLERYTLPAKSGTEGVGGFCFDKDNAGFPGKVCAQNITQDEETGLGRWTDGEIARAIREGVNREGAALFPMMPYPWLKYLSDEDTKSVVAYLRTVTPIKNETEEGHIDFPVNLFIKFEPKPVTEPVPQPDRKDTVAYGKYLATISCVECHTPVDSTMHPLMDQLYTGGREFDLSKMLPGLKLVSANLTPDEETGIGQKSRENFIAQFKAFADPEYASMKVESQHNTLMPWVRYSKMTEEDLGAIYDYLRSLPSVRKPIERRLPPKIAKADATPAATPSP